MIGSLHLYAIGFSFLFLAVTLPVKQCSGFLVPRKEIIKTPGEAETQHHVFFISSSQKHPKQSTDNNFN
jgi:hypothetical protein